MQPAGINIGLVFSRGCLDGMYFKKGLPSWCIRGGENRGRIETSTTRDRAK